MERYNPTTPPLHGDARTGLIFARVLDGRGGARAIDWDACQHWQPAQPQETLWLHMDRTVASVESWLIDALHFGQATADALLAEETRPRAFVDRDALVTVLRGINLSPGAEPDDMITLRLWATAGRLLTLRRRPVRTPSEIVLLLDRGQGPATTGDLVSTIIEQTVGAIGGSIATLNDRIDTLEAGIAPIDDTAFLGVLTDLRRQSLGMKRHMSPQHEALEQIYRAPPTWLGEANQNAIRETIDRLKRFLEDLDVTKESVIVLQDDLNNRIAAQANRRVYLLTVTAAIFLPVSLVTALVGADVGGMPLRDDPLGFLLLCGVVAVLIGVELVAFRWLKWI